MPQKEREEAEHRLRSRFRHARHPILRIWLDSCHHRGIIVLVILWFVLGYKRKQEVEQALTRSTGIAKKKMQLLPLISARIKNTALLCMLMLMIGYSSYALIVIRSSANPPMDQNSPEDIFTLGSYLSRDQYGDRPLFYGQAYTLTGSPRGRRQHVQACHEGRRTGLPAQGEGFG